MGKKHGKTGKLRYGSVSVLLAVLILLSLIAVNIGAEILEKKNGWRRDYSFNSIVTQSPETVEILKRLERPVKIWALFQKGNEDAPLMELLDRYAAASDKVTWEQVDPALNPALISRFTSDSAVPGSDSLIVYCEETDRFRILGPSDYVSVGMDMDTGDYTYTGWTYERSITGAISYVTREKIPQAVILQGHGELDGEKTATFAGLLQANQYDVAYADLTDANYTPDPGDLLIFFSPLRDMTEVELQKLAAFADAGGSFLFTCDYSDGLKNMPNYTALLRSYGFLPQEGVVIADAADANTYYNGNTVWLLPEMVSTDLTMDLIASGANHILMPGARSLEEPDESDRNLIVSVVLRSGETSFRKKLTADTLSLTRGEEDPQGSFPLALQARRVTSGGYVSRAFIIGSSAALTEQQLYSMTDCQQLIIRVTEFLLGTDAADLSIMAKEALRPSLGTESTGLGSLMIVALPLAVLAAAILILGPRRNR